MKAIITTIDEEFQKGRGKDTKPRKKRATKISGAVKKPSGDSWKHETIGEAMAKIHAAREQKWAESRKEMQKDKETSFRKLR